jgi:hypothetical protein
MIVPVPVPVPVPEAEAESDATGEDADADADAGAIADAEAEGEADADADADGNGEAEAGAEALVVAVGVEVAVEVEVEVAVEVEVEAEVAVEVGVEVGFAVAVAVEVEVEVRVVVVAGVVVAPSRSFIAKAAIAAIPTIATAMMALPVPRFFSGAFGFASTSAVGFASVFGLSVFGSTFSGAGVVAAAATGAASSCFGDFTGGGAGLSAVPFASRISAAPAMTSAIALAIAFGFVMSSTCGVSFIAIGGDSAAACFGTSGETGGLGFCGAFTAAIVSGFSPSMPAESSLRARPSISSASSVFPSRSAMCPST